MDSEELVEASWMRELGRKHSDASGLLATFANACVQPSERDLSVNVRTSTKDEEEMDVLSVSSACYKQDRGNRGSRGAHDDDGREEMKIRAIQGGHPFCIYTVIRNRLGGSAD